MPEFKASPLGILKCRDLCTLYYGFPMVADEKSNQFNLPNDSSLVPILGQDPRRIKYEIVLENVGTPGGQIQVGTQTELDNGTNLEYSLAGHTTVVVRRDFLTDLDSVCSALFASTAVNSMFVSVRETFLTPAPVDEVPLP